MTTSAKDFGSYTLLREVVAAGTLGVTNAGTASVDMRTCRQGLLMIDLVVGTDVPSDFILQHSHDDSTWATLEAVADADLLASDILTYDLENMERYVRLTWTRALANADSQWCVLVLGDLAVRTPLP